MVNGLFFLWVIDQKAGCVQLCRWWSLGEDVFPRVQPVPVDGDRGLQPLISPVASRKGLAPSIPSSPVHAVLGSCSQMPPAASPWPDPEPRSLFTLNCMCAYTALTFEGKMELGTKVNVTRKDQTGLSASR